MMTRTALGTIILVTLPLLLAGCGGGSDKQARTPDQPAAAPAPATDFDPCALLTADEIKSAVGWAPDSSQKKAYGTTGNCIYFGPKALTDQVSLLVGQGMPDMSDSRKMADWRAKQYKDYKVNDAIVEPVEGLGVPAIRNEFGMVAIEMAIGDQLVSVTGLSAKFPQVRQLAGYIVARMK